MSRKAKIEELRRIVRENARARQNAKKSGDKNRHNKRAAYAAAKEVLEKLLEPRRPPEVRRDRVKPVESKELGRFLAKHFTGMKHDHVGDNAVLIDPRRRPAKAIQLAYSNRYKASPLGGTVLDIRDDGGMGELVTMDEQMKELQRLHDEVFLFHRLMTLGNEEYRQNPRKSLKRTAIWQRYMAAVEPLRKAMVSTSAGNGDEWVPTGWSQDFIDQVLLGTPVGRLFPVVNMPTQPFDVFGMGALPTAYSPAEGSAPSAISGTASTKRTITADQFKAYDTITDEMTEDSAVEAVSRMQQQLVLALAMGWESAIINGDSSGTHGDNDIHGGAADHVAKTSWIGLRHTAIDNSYTSDVGQTSSPTLAHLLNIRREMGRGFAEDPRNHVWVTSSQGYLTHILNTQGSSTVDLFGQDRAVIRTGSISSIAGSDVLLSHMFPENLHDTGVNASGQANDTTGILCVHTRSAFVGYRRQTRIEADKAITTGVTTIVASMRGGFQWRYAPASNALIGYGINVRTAATA